MLCDTTYWNGCPFHLGDHRDDSEVDFFVEILEDLHPALVTEGPGFDGLLKVGLEVLRIEEAPARVRVDLQTRRYETQRIPHEIVSNITGQRRCEETRISKGHDRDAFLGAMRAKKVSFLVRPHGSVDETNEVWPVPFCVAPVLFEPREHIRCHILALHERQTSLPQPVGRESEQKFFLRGTQGMRCVLEIGIIVATDAQEFDIEDHGLLRVSKSDDQVGIIIGQNGSRTDRLNANTILPLTR
jgi:hypothetical protein